jgi:hypothetical protein
MQQAFRVFERKTSSKTKKKRNHRGIGRNISKIKRIIQSIARNITKFLDMQKYKCHVVKLKKTFSAIPCFLPHEPKRRAKNKNKRTWKAKQNIEGLVFTSLEG